MQNLASSCVVADCNQLNTPHLTISTLLYSAQSKVGVMFFYWRKVRRTLSMFGLSILGYSRNKVLQHGRGVEEDPISL